MRRAGAIALTVAALLLAACTSNHTTGSRAGGTASTTSPDAFTAVVIGDDATLPTDPDTPASDTWPQEFFVTALPRAARFVNLATGPITIADVVSREVSVLHDVPTRVAVVLLGFDDVGAGVPATQFGAALSDVLAAVHRAGVERVLVGTLPSGAAGATAVDAYDEQIRSAVTAARDVLVDLRAVTVSGAIDPPTRVFFPDSAGHLAIAHAFTGAYRAAFPSP